MEKKLCQSCGMPLESDDQLGTNKDGSPSAEYCVYCYKDGEFTDGCTDMESYIEKCAELGPEAGMTKEEMKAHCQELFPHLKRWK